VALATSALLCPLALCPGLTILSPTAEQIAETVILFAGGGMGRVTLNQIRRNGVERGRLTRTGQDGRVEEVRYELRFVRGDKPEKDKVRFDSKTPQAEYSLVYGGGRVFGLVNGSIFTPRADATAGFIAQQAHSIDALLRYKENESKLTSAGKDKQQGVGLYVIDLTDKANRQDAILYQRQNLSRVVLDYEEIPPGSTTAVKYTRRFYDLSHGAEHLGTLPHRSARRRKADLRNPHSYDYLRREDGDSLFKNRTPHDAGNP